MSDIQEINLDNLKTIMEDIISNYCIDKNIDESDIPPQRWNAIIQILHETIFRDNRNLLRNDHTQYNEYNIDKVLHVYNIYKYISNDHGQEITIKKFCDLTGIDRQTLYNWNDGKLSSQRFDILEKIHADNEESLESMLHDKRYNPMKILPSLNRKHQWNLPGVSREKTDKQSLSAADLPKLSLADGHNTMIESKD